jgi:hypothetical protein
LGTEVRTIQLSSDDSPIIYTNANFSVGAFPTAACNFGNCKYEQQIPAALRYKVARQPKVQSGWIQWVLAHHFHQFSQSFWVTLK